MLTLRDLSRDFILIPLTDFVRRLETKPFVNRNFFAGLLQPVFNSRVNCRDVKVRYVQLGHNLVLDFTRDLFLKLLVLDQLQFPSYGRVPMVLYGVISPTWLQLGDNCPAVAQADFLQSKGYMRWASMISKSSFSVQRSFLISGFKWLCHLLVRITGLPFTALFADAPRLALGQEAPVPRPVLLDHFYNYIILVFGPGPFDQIRVQHFLPPMQALHVRPVPQIRCNTLPVLRSVLLHQLPQLFILSQVNKLKKYCKVSSQSKINKSDIPKTPKLPHVASTTA